jgi:hypothetical protein
MTPFQPILSNIKALDRKVIITFGSGQTAEAASVGDIGFTCVSCAVEKGATFTFYAALPKGGRVEESLMISVHAVVRVWAALVEAKRWGRLYTFKASYQQDSCRGGQERVPGALAQALSALGPQQLVQVFRHGQGHHCYGGRVQEGITKGAAESCNSPFSL